MRFVEVVGKFAAQAQKFFNGVIERHFVEQFAFVAQVTELLQADTRELFKNVVGDNRIERRKRNGIVDFAVSH